MALILCIPSDFASYLFKDYENFFDSLRPDTIFTLFSHLIFLPRIILEKKMVELWFLFSAYCPMKLYICSKFHENIDGNFKVIEWIRF